MSVRPPRVAQWLLALAIRDPEWREAVLGDLTEELDDITRRTGTARARWWYRRQAAGLVAHRAVAGVFRSSAMPRRLPEPVEPRAGLAGVLWHDVRQAWRSIRHQPALAATIVVVLAAGLAANAAVFAMADAIVLRPFRYPGVERAVVIASDGRQRFFARESVTPGDFLDWQDQAGDVLSRLAAITWWDPTYTHDGPPQQIAGFHVTPALFDILGTHAFLGRSLTEADARGDAHVAVISHGFWVRQFAASRDVAGRTVWLDGTPHRIVGVMPPNFTVPFGADVWAPLVLPPGAREDRTQGHMMVVGELKPGVAVGAADGRMQAILAQERRAYPDLYAKREVSVRSFTDGFGDAGAGPFVAIWQIASLLLLIVACANVANLLLARNAERQREVAVRLALGASGSRITWQLLVEALLLSGMASVLALPLIWAAVGALRGALPDSILRFVPGVAYLGVHVGTFVFTAALAIVATVLAALVPAWRASRGSVSESLRPGTRVSDGAGRQRGRAVLATAQIALTLALLATAGFSLIALRRASDGPLGFGTGHILTGRIALPDGRYGSPEARRQFLDRTLDRLKTIPAVTDAGAASVLPYTGTNAYTSFWPDGTPTTATAAVNVQLRRVTPNALPILAVPLLSGRQLTQADDERATDVALVGRGLAARFWPDGSALGQRFRLSPDGPLVTVVGVVGDVSQDWIGDLNDGPVLYRPLAQDPSAGISLVVRTVPDPDQLAAQLRAAVQAVDPDQPVTDVRSMEKVVDDKTVGLRFASNMLGVIALVSSFLSTVGLYSLMAFLTSRRTREIGVRMALGASRWDVIALTGRTAARLTAAGVALGLVLAWGAGRLMEQVMFGVVQADVRLAAGLAVVLVIVSLAASYLPARRAAALDPTVALRTE